MQIDIQSPLALLGGLSPSQFMKTHWQKKPLLIRQAIAGFKPLLGRDELFALIEQAGVETRLVAQKEGEWLFTPGPLTRRKLPGLKRPNWTVLVQGVDLHHGAVHDLLQQFRFVPDARLDDVMVSYATHGGGVGPHFDNYDVFLLQAHGRRRWRIGRQKDLTLKPDMPLKILANFEPEHDWMLEPGDMLYLPPKYAHDGIAEGECMTYSIGFRSPDLAGLTQELLIRLSEDLDDVLGEVIYKDPKQAAVNNPGQIPDDLVAFAKAGLTQLLGNEDLLRQALGEVLTEPKPHVWFDGSNASPPVLKAVGLHPKTRMMYADRHIFINGMSYRAAGKDASLMKAFADKRFLTEKQVFSASSAAKTLLAEWIEDGWVTHLN